MVGTDPPIWGARTGPHSSELSLTQDDLTTHSVDQEETSNLVESQARESMSVEWTDEKHSLYLKSMETSFVNQLYNSFDLLGWRPQRDSSSDPKSSRQIHARNSVSTGQYKVLQDGCWAKINFRRDESHSKKVDECGVLQANPWVRHFRSGGRHTVKTSHASKEEAALASTSNRFSVSQSHLCRQDSVGSNTEVTDQNFVDEDFKREKSNKMCRTKRMKTTVVAASSNDEVVPFGKYPDSEDDGENTDSPKE